MLTSVGSPELLRALKKVIVWSCQMADPLCWTAMSKRLRPSFGNTKADMGGLPRLPRPKLVTPLDKIILRHCLSKTRHLPSLLAYPHLVLLQGHNSCS